MTGSEVEFLDPARMCADRHFGSFCLAKYAQTVSYDGPWDVDPFETVRVLVAVECA